MKNIYLFVILQCCILSSLYAQTGEIQGKVTDAETGETMPFVNVVINKADIPLVGTSTDFDGIYSLNSVHPGIYTITFSYLGYQKIQVEKVEVKANEISLLSIELSPVSYMLDSVKILLYQSFTLSNKQTLKEPFVTGEQIKSMPARGLSNSPFFCGFQADDFGSIAGKVTDTQRREAIPFVNVAIEVSGNVVGTSTDFDGTYKLDSVFVGFYTVTFSSPFYQSLKIDSIEVHKDNTTFLETKVTTRDACEGAPEISVRKRKKMQRKARRIERKKGKQ